MFHFMCPCVRLPYPDVLSNTSGCCCKGFFYFLFFSMWLSFKLVDLKLIRQVSLYKLGGSHPTSWKPWENNWFPPKKRKFCQWTAFGFKLQCLFFSSSLGCLPSCLSCRFWTCQPPPSHEPIPENQWNQSFSPTSCYFSLSLLDGYVCIYIWVRVCVCACIHVYAHTHPVDCFSGEP